MQRLVRYSLLCLSFFFMSTLFLAKRLPEGKHGIPFPSRRNRSEHRIAIILPYTVAAAAGAAASKEDSSSPNVASVLPYFPAFCVGAAGAAEIADFLIFHTGILNNEWPLLKTECPDNVKFIDLGSPAGLAERLLRVLDHKEKTTTVLEKSELLELVTSFIKVNPYGLVEFKPALGYIFQDFLTDYTHWGYSDIDILFGDLGRWVTPDELTDFDIVTYTFGDQQRLYLRGQFTFHKNTPEINQLWRKCEYLSDMDVRFQKLVERSKQYRVESAEGCYSDAVMGQNDIAVKFAVKAWTDIYTEDTAYSHGVFLSRDHSTGRQILYKATEENIEESGKLVSRLQPGWFEKDGIYKNRMNLIQREVGPRTRVEYKPDPESNCMYWVMQKYQSKLCVKEKIYKDETVFWINGQLYKQHHENAALNTPVETAPFFHFQEWKRSYRFEQLSSLYLSSPIHTFVLLPEGAIPTIEGKRTTSGVPSPLGLVPMKRWNDDDDGSQLPGNTYCLVSDVDGSGQRTKCVKAVSWYDADHTTILSGAPSWTNINIESDVTLALTLQISASQAMNQRALHNIVDHLMVSMNRWHGQPCVLVVSISGSTKEAFDFIKEQLGVANTAVSYSSLIAVVQEKTPTEVSRKALLNMAIDAVPTRWYVSGLELERGLSISVDAAFFAHRAAASYGQLRGNIFILPQFGLVDFGAGDKSSQKETDIVISLSDLIDAQSKSKCKNLSQFDETCDNDDDIPEILDHFERVDSLWWNDANMIADPKLREDASSVRKMSRRASALNDIEHSILELATGDNQRHIMYALDETPLLLIDNLGPHDGIRTNEIAREIESLAGLRCYSGLRLLQLAILGYKFDVLGGAFAASSEASRKAAQSGASDDRLTRCDGCFMFRKDKYDVLDSLARSEIKRAAKTSIMWAETIGLKQ